jgi:hypothetical protein
MFIAMLSSKDDSFNKTNESKVVTNLMIAYRWRTKKIVNRVYSRFLTIIKEKESIDNNNNE